MFYADLHIHSPYSQTVSPKMTLPEIEKTARQKGISVMGTGDCFHPVWMGWIESMEEDPDTGLLYREANGVQFIPTVEVSCEKGRKKMHMLLFFPDMQMVHKIRMRLEKYGNLDKDGRPTLKMLPGELMDAVKSKFDDVIVVAAHILTPHTGILGDRNHYESIYEVMDVLPDAIETGLSCYDDKTEMLTEDGWKYVKEVNLNDTVCTLNGDTGVIEYQEPEAIHSYYYRGKMYKFCNRNIDLLVTPNHRLFCRTRTYHYQTPYHLKDAEKTFGKGKIMKNTGLWIGDSSQNFVLPSVRIKHGGRWGYKWYVKKEKRIPMTDWLKFFGFWIADGHISYDRKGSAYNVIVGKSNKRLILELKRIMTKAGFNPYFYIAKSNVNKVDIYNIRIRNYQLYSYLKQFGKAHEKFIPKEIKQLSLPLLRIFLKYYLKGDGHISNNQTGCGSVSKQLIDDLMETALKIGISAHYSLDRKKGEKQNQSLPGLTPTRKRDYWSLRFLKSKEFTIRPGKEKWVNYSGNVYCVSVLNSIVYIRRNGKPLWCGNSDKGMVRSISELKGSPLLSFSDAHSLPNIGREVTRFEGEISWKNIAESIRTDKIDTVEYPPALGKYHYSGHRKCQHSVGAGGRPICPKCFKRITMGVEQRIEDLKDTEVSVKETYMIPLIRLIGVLTNDRHNSPKVTEIYNGIVASYPEISILVDLDLRTIPIEFKTKIPKDELREIITLMRHGQLGIIPGYDGQFGKIVNLHDIMVKKLDESNNLFMSNADHTLAWSKAERINELMVSDRMTITQEEYETLHK